MTVLSAKKISKKFFKPSEINVLNDISLDVQHDESIAIVGKSGEGKSTLLQILGTLDHATSGQLFINGQDTSSSNVNEIRNRFLGFVFQNYHLLEERTALENILIPAAISRASIKKNSPYYQKALHLLEVVGLIERRDFLVNLLSGGEKQRVAIARSLILAPSILLADEPTGNLDSKTSCGIHELLFSKELTGNSAKIIVTHDMELASLCDKIYILQEGQLKNFANKPLLK